MTEAERAELARLIAESIAKAEAAQPADWWSLLDSWGPAIAVPVLTLAAVLVGAWRGLPRLLAWFDQREQHREAREDEIREAYFDSLRGVTQNTRCLLDSQGNEEHAAYADTGTARMRRRMPLR